MYLLVLTRSDLCEVNITVNPDTGNITGIVDWAETKVLPFAMSLWGFLNVLGVMDSDGWHYHENSSTMLEGLFWDTLYRKVGFMGFISDER